MMMLQFKIQLANVKPAVWRRVIAPATISFDKFHWVIQAAFGWRGYHLYQFSPGGYGTYPVICIPHEDYDDEFEDSQKIKLNVVFDSVGQKFDYNYDFGDDWVHKIILEAITNTKSTKSALLAGKGACPPEDCGGPHGYVELLKIINSPQHTEREKMLEWLGLEEGETWNANLFDIGTAQKMVNRL
jgi:hypothetical protein